VRAGQVGGEADHEVGLFVEHEAVAQGAGAHVLETPGCAARD
jgi:hypothetical protein